MYKREGGVSAVGSMSEVEVAAGRLEFGQGRQDHLLVMQRMQATLPKLHMCKRPRRSKDKVTVHMVTATSNMNMCMCYIPRTCKKHENVHGHGQENEHEHEEGHKN